MRVDESWRSNASESFNSHQLSFSFDRALRLSGLIVLYLLYTTPVVSPSLHRIPFHSISFRSAPFYMLCYTPLHSTLFHIYLFGSVFVVENSSYNRDLFPSLCRIRHFEAHEEPLKGFQVEWRSKTKSCGVRDGNCLHHPSCDGIWYRNAERNAAIFARYNMDKKYIYS